MILVIDNYDSFTFNLVRYLRELKQPVQVYRNDALTCQDIESFAPSHILISPGPGDPGQAGIACDVIQHFAASIPILGVCLGHQCLAKVFGGEVVRAGCVMHGKNSQIYHHQQGLFADLPNPLSVTRYHSLVVAQATLPPCFKITAWTEDTKGQMDEIMGLEHTSHPLFGVQFHPEAHLTEHGHHLLQNFLSV